MGLKHGLSFIRKENIPVKGADISPMDFFGFGYIKQGVTKPNVRSRDGIWKKCSQVWDALGPEVCHNVFQARKRRCRTVNKRGGGHVEQVKSIHRHKVSKKNP